MNIFSKAFRASKLSRFMKISLYKDWLEVMQLNRNLENSGSDKIDVIPVSDRYAAIIDKLSQETIMDFKVPDTQVVRQGYRETDYMYIISQGKCKVSVFDRSNKTGKMQDIDVRQLESNDYFGEISLVYDSVRSSTVTCTNYCTLGRIGLKTLHTLCANHNFVKHALLKSI